MRIEPLIMWARIKRAFKETIPMKIAFWMPKRVAYWCFIRVHSLSGDGPSYDGEFKKAADLASLRWGI